MTGTFVITQGEHHATDARDATISTILGSCVACCLWDPVARVGGMNHILLAITPNCPDMTPSLTAMNAMELLINDMLKLGAFRRRLLAKAFGGASMISGLSEIGAANGTFLLNYLEREGIECVSQSLGGARARHIVFTPATGAVRMKLTGQVVPEEVVRPKVDAGNGLEIF